MACKHAIADCSHLPFSTMHILSKTDNHIIVRCTEFEHANRPTQRQADSRASEKAAAHT
ncbi:hypothetical protein SAMN04487867_104115 [Vreelandella titanicae]|uniref:hypothetical protein n=1 Tax=Vreelandella titanicae TaxID=664683 RepID=UPI000881672C|nr:hypothetical protein [Halomonas titanicae]SDI28929.1 hypothetical protein SAMN04487867_104115 [Halomonas titanicae]